MLHTTAPLQPDLAVDLTKLNRLHKWLVGFFYTAVGSLIAVIALPTNVNADSDIGLVLGFAFMIGSWGYLITLGRMAAALHKSVIIWFGLTLITSIFGFIGSFIMMNSRVSDARKNGADRAQAIA